MALAICVYCGARSGNDPAVEAAATALGAAIAARGWQLIYGGGRVGLMGAVARSALGGGAAVVGIIPQALLEREQGMAESSELIVTQTLRQRKAIMDERAHAFIALPGGFGTLEETVETLTLRQLGYHNKPIILLNLGGYYDPLLSFFDHIISQGYASPENTQLYHAVSSVAEAIALLEKLEPGE